MKKAKREHTRQFWCDTCKQGGGPGMTPAELKKHLKSVHQLEGRITGSKKLVCALDGEEGYDNTLEWLLPGNVKICELSSGPR